MGIGLSSIISIKGYTQYYIHTGVNMWESQEVQDDYCLYNNSTGVGLCYNPHLRIQCYKELL